MNELDDTRDTLPKNELIKMEVNLGLQYNFLNSRMPQALTISLLLDYIVNMNESLDQIKLSISKSDKPDSNSISSYHRSHLMFN